MKLYTLTGVFLFSLATQVGLGGTAQAAWTLIAAVNSEGVRAYADLDRAKRDGSKRKVWTLFDYDKPQNHIYGSPPYLSELFLEQMDCSDDTYSVLENVAYAGNQGSGQSVFDTSPQKPTRMHIVPETIRETVENLVCR